MIAGSPPFTARGLLRIAALAAVLTLAPLVLWSSIGLRAPAGALAASAISDWWPQAWAQYGSSVERSLRLAAACVAVAILVTMPWAKRWIHSPPAVAARWAQRLQRPMAVPVLATTIACVLAFTPSRGRLADFGLLLLAHAALTLPFVMQCIGSALARQSAGASASALAQAALGACLLAFVLSLGESSLTALLGAPMAPPWPAALATMRSEAATLCAAAAAATALPLLWGMGAMADALGATRVRTSWADRS